MNRLATLLKKGAELFGATVFAVMFGTFLVQITMRYLFREPFHWALELCMICYTWLILWNCALSLHERDHISFDMLYQVVGDRVRRVFALLGALAVALSFFAAVPATYDYVSFMHRHKTPALNLPFDWVYSVFLLFLLGVGVRQAVVVVRLLRSKWRDWI